MPEDAPPIKFELCIASVFDAGCGAIQGVDRVELNSALELGGLTPSIGMAEQVSRDLRHRNIQVIAMVRPRPGGFDYDARAMRVMRRDIERLLEVGVDGVAFGVLNRDSTINQVACAELIEPVLSGARQAVFHRAFDFHPDPLTGLKKLIDLGFHRVMTTGGEATALEGAETIRALVEKADGRIEVLPAGGIRPHNVAELVSKTGCTQVHAALMDEKPDGSLRSNPAIEFNSPPPPNGRFKAADSNAVQAMVEALKEI